MITIRHILALVLAAALLAAACSPESDRSRGGGKGADIGNRPDESVSVEVHGTINPAFDVPAVGTNKGR